jgi:hypothetical protein
VPARHRSLGRRSQDLRTASLADSATLALSDLRATDGSAKQKAVSLQELASTIADRKPILILTVSNGVIVAVKEHFTP